MKSKKSFDPVEMARRIRATVEELTEAVEDYCLSKAMDEGRRTPLLERDDALAFLHQYFP